MIDLNFQFASELRKNGWTGGPTLFSQTPSCDSDAPRQVDALRILCPDWSRIGERATSTASVTRRGNMETAEPNDGSQKEDIYFFLGRIFSQSHRLGTFSGFLPNFGGMFGTVFEKTPNGWDLRRPTLAQNIGSNTNKHIGLSHLGMSMQELVSIFGIRQYSSAVISCSSNHLLR
jgi:hypothetical protein